MALNLTMIKNPVAQTAIKILNLEASQLSFPESAQLANGALAAYAVTQAATQAFDHSIIGSIAYGLFSGAVAYGATLYLLRYMKQEDKFNRTLLAIAGFGAIAAIAYCVLHIIFSIALPPPLPTERLLRFLLFPINVWLVFLFAFFYRHVAMRPIPAFVAAAFYVLIVQIIAGTLFK